MDGGKIQFLGGNQLAALENHSYKPGLAGVDGTAPASYRGTASGVIVLFSLPFAAAADVARRRISFDVTSQPLAIVGETFPAGAINYQFLETQNGVVDFAISGPAKAKGSKVLGGLLTNGVSVAGTLSGGVLNIPVDASFRFVTKTSGLDVEFKLFFKGKLVAKEGTAPEQPLVKFEPFVSAQPLKLFWSPSYKLQRATTLSPLNWADFATVSPVSIPTIQPGEYFRVVHK
ncbi:MAG: hypothetical protein EXS36_04320 [Pedosphaera sp.]|nr:hypothetical protein [Pedosphaera sp.]